MSFEQIVANKSRVSRGGGSNSPTSFSTVASPIGAKLTRPKTTPSAPHVSAPNRQNQNGSELLEQGFNYANYYLEGLIRYFGVLTSSGLEVTSKPFQ